MFGIDHSPDAAPDIVAMAKGIAGGFPLGAFMAKEPVSEAMKPGDHLSTFGGNPISCAAALANLDVIREENLVENSARRGEELLNRLKRLEGTSARVGEVGGRGLMVGLELVKDKTSKAVAADETKRPRDAPREWNPGGRGRVRQGSRPAAAVDHGGRMRPGRLGAGGGAPMTLAPRAPALGVPAALAGCAGIRPGDRTLAADHVLVGGTSSRWTGSRRAPKRSRSETGSSSRSARRRRCFGARRDRTTSPICTAGRSCPG
jgi:hypothetical protein